MSDLAHGLHDHRVHKTRGKQVARIPRSCLECGQDSTPRYAYCSDECSRLSRERATAAMVSKKGRK